MKKIRKDKRGVFGLTAIQSFFAIILGIALLAYVIVVITGTLDDATILSDGSGDWLNDSKTAANSTGVTLSAASLSSGACGSLTAVWNTAAAANSTGKVNESGGLNTTAGYTVAAASLYGFSSPALIKILNATDNSTIALANATISAAGVIKNTSSATWEYVRYTYNYTILGSSIALANFTQSSCVITNASVNPKTFTTNLLYNYPYTYRTTAQDSQRAILQNTSTGVTGFFEDVNPVYAILGIMVIILVLVVLVRVVNPQGRQGTPQL